LRCRGWEPARSRRFEANSVTYAFVKDNYLVVLNVSSGTKSGADMDSQAGAAAQTVGRVGVALRADFVRWRRGWDFEPTVAINHTAFRERAIEASGRSLWAAECHSEYEFRGRSCHRGVVRDG